jgi:hypothetical protein
MGILARQIQQLFKAKIIEQTISVISFYFYNDDIQNNPRTKHNAFAYATVR